MLIKHSYTRIAALLAILVVSTLCLGARVRVAGTAIRPECNVYGRIVNSQTGRGIAGVPVSDGYSFTTTDRRGVYQMKTDSLCRKVFYTTPSGYKVALDGEHYPAFYTPGKVDVSKRTRYDFALEPLEAPENNLTLVMVSDPQCKRTEHSDRYSGETIPSIQRVLAENQAEGRYLNAYAFTLGDITADSFDMWETMHGTMADVAVGDGWLPFFQCIGNHDHNSMVHTGDYDATQKFTDVFGPTDYSVNRGKVHIIVMDDIMVTKVKDAKTTFNKYSWKYNGGFTDAQMRWLREDLALVEDKQDKMVVLCLHIPFREGSSKGGHNINLDKHYSDVLSMLTEFNQAHIMIGHTHYSDSRVHGDYMTRSGLPVYEHVHGAACGAWWRCDSNANGGPNGYGIYEIEGASMKNWIARSTKDAADYQMKVYDGNQIYTGTAGFEYCWYRKECKGGPKPEKMISAKGAPELRGCLIADVWGDDDTYWTVEIFKDGRKVADMQRLPSGSCSNMMISSLFFNEMGRSTAAYALHTSSHYWYWKTPCEPSEYDGWEIVATQRIPGSDAVNVYRCSHLTTDYSEF